MIIGNMYVCISVDKTQPLKVLREDFARVVACGSLTLALRKMMGRGIHWVRDEDVMISKKLELCVTQACPENEARQAVLILRPFFGADFQVSFFLWRVVGFTMWCNGVDQYSDEYDVF